MTKEFHEEIDDLKKNVYEMGHLAIYMLENGLKSLFNNDISLANSVLQYKHKIKEYDINLEEVALKLIALHQPMAIDLRRVAASLKIVTNIERIGRYGKDIAQITEKLVGKPLTLKLINLQHVWEHTNKMIVDSLEAFDKENIDLIKDFAQRDNEVDQLRWSIFQECVSYMIEDPKNITTCAHYIMVARYLERCADHACKIAEKVHYIVTGKQIEID